MDKWFKSILLDNGSEVLILKEEDNESEAPYKVSTICDFEGCRGKISMCFKTEDAQNKAFQQSTKETATEVHKSLFAFTE